MAAILLFLYMIRIMLKTRVLAEEANGLVTLQSVVGMELRESMMGLPSEKGDYFCFNIKETENKKISVLPEPSSSFRFNLSSPFCCFPPISIIE